MNINYYLTTDICRIMIIPLTLVPSELVLSVRRRVSDHSTLDVTPVMPQNLRSLSYVVAIPKNPSIDHEYRIRGARGLH